MVVATKVYVVVDQGMLRAGMGSSLNEQDDVGSVADRAILRIGSCMGVESELGNDEETSRDPAARTRVQIRCGTRANDHPLGPTRSKTRRPPAPKYWSATRRHT